MAPPAPVVWHPAAFRHLPAGRADNVVATTPEVMTLLARDCVVAVSISSGKDSDASAIAVDEFLRSIGHSGPRVLVHADLGRIEWRDSLPRCQRLADRLGWELMVVRRAAGDLLARWQVRWANNVSRYRNLDCVKLILPWSTPALRFCTSETKTAAITSALKKRFPDSDIINVVGIRREESPGRSRKPVAAPMPQLVRKGHLGLTWHPIIEWPVEDVLAKIASVGVELHEAYVRYGSSRLSCAFCIMSSQSDLAASISCLDNHQVFRALVALEADSTFGFQGRWLGDLAPEVLGIELRERFELAKKKAVERQRIEAEIPAHLLYQSGWPTVLPTTTEAQLLASVRQRIGALVGIEVLHTDGDSVRARYEELLEAKSLSMEAS